MRDRLPNNPKSVECGVVNLDNHNNDGTHWVAYAKIKSYCEYFDSFGDLKPPTELVKYLKGTEILYNYNRFQNFDTVNCGHLCLNFLNLFWADLGVY